MKLNQKLKMAREHLGKSQREMADLVGSGYRSWQGYEQDTSIPGGKVFQSLADLGFNTHWFFSDDVPMMQAEEHRISQAPANSQSAANNKSIPHMPSDKLGLGESVELLAKIYNSGNTVLIRAIAANLHAFSEAVDNKALAQKAIDMMDEMNKRMLAMEKDLAIMKVENEELKKRAPAKDQNQATG